MQNKNDRERYIYDQKIMEIETAMDDLQEVKRNLEETYATFIEDSKKWYFSMQEQNEQILENEIEQQREEEFKFFIRSMEEESDDITSQVSKVTIELDEKRGDIQEERDRESWQ